MPRANLPSLHSLLKAGVFVGGATLLWRFLRAAAARRRRRVCVLGAGVIGLATAAQLHREYGNSVDITVMADRFLKDTTSGGAGGLWEPYALSHTDPARVTAWGRVAYAEFSRLAANPATALAAGVQRVVAYEFFDDAAEAQPLPDWAATVESFRVLPTPAALAASGALPTMPTRFQAGWYGAK